MSRVHCLECGGVVVLDPNGICPEGHHVGASGARIEQAIGFAMEHPDEPEPWVYRIEESELALAGAGRNGTSPHGNRLRAARPAGLLDAEQDTDSSDAERLLRELHSLATFDEEQVEPPADAATSSGRVDDERDAMAMPTPPPPPTAASPSAAHALRRDPDAIAEAFAELSALDVPDAAMTPRTPANGQAQRGGPDAAPNDTTHHAGEGAPIDDEFAALFDAAPPPRPALPPDVVRRAPTDPPPAPAAPHTPPRPDAPPGGPPGEPNAPDTPPVNSDAADARGAMAAPSGPATTDDPGGEHHSIGQHVEDLDRLLQDLSGDEVLFGGSGGGTTPPPDAPVTPGTPGATPAAAQPAPPPANPSPPVQASSAPDRPAQTATPPDLSSFTAKGGAAARGGKRRRFGR